MLAKLALGAVMLLGTSLALGQDGGVIHRSKASKGVDAQQFTLSEPTQDVRIHYYAAHCVHGSGGSPVGVEIHIAKSGGNFSRTLRHKEPGTPGMHEVVQTDGPFSFPAGSYDYVVRGIGEGSDLNATAACIGQGETCGADPFAGAATSC